MPFWMQFKNIHVKAIPALQKMDVSKNHIKITYTHRTKKAFPRHPLSGSMTIEAALVFPLVFFVWVAFISLISAVKVRETIQQSLTDSVQRLAVEAGEDEELIRSTGMLRIWSDLRALEDLETGGIDLVSGYNFSGTRILEGDEWLELHVSYRVKLLDGLIPVPDIPMKNDILVRAWTGYTPDGSYSGMGRTDKHVYVTEYGCVYHEDRMCSHIRLKIYMVDSNEVKRYLPCEKCVRQGFLAGRTYYVTESGECYHSRLGCSGLKRSVQRMTVEEAVMSGCVPCSRCCGGGG